MFQTLNIEATLKRFDVTAKGESRQVRCILMVRPLDYALANELSEDLAAELFVNPSKPRPHIKTLTVDVPIKRQTVTFRAAPSVAAPIGIIHGVDITNLQIVRGSKMGGQFEFRLLFDAKFTISDKATASRLQMEYLGQSVFLSFETMQKQLFDEDRNLVVTGKFINDRAKQGRAGFGIRPAVGGGSRDLKGERL